LKPSQFWDQVFADVAFDYVATHASRECGPLKSAGIMLAHDEYLNGRELCLDSLGHLQAIHSRHGDVEEYDIRLMFSDFAQGVSAIQGLANNFDVSLGTENLTDAATDALVVICHEHTKYASSHSISGGGTSLALLIQRNSDWVLQGRPTSLVQATKLFHREKT
jgi:hypothetical protein